LYVTPHNIGISWGNASHLRGVFATYYLGIFLANLDIEKHKTPLQIARSLTEYIRSIDPETDAQFHVAGYDLTDRLHPIPQLYKVTMKENKIELSNEDSMIPTLIYAGAVDYIQSFLPFMVDNFKNFSIQDVIDLSVFLIKTTQNLLRFQGIAEIVGGPIDVLVIRPNGSKWINHKEFHT
jgi:hypothetical protein